MALDYAPVVPMDSAAPLAAPSVSLPSQAREEAVRHPDFIMNKRRTQQHLRNPRSNATRRELNAIPKRIVNEGVEYRSNRDQQALNREREKHLEAATKEVLSLHVNAMKRFRRAEKYLANLSKDEEEYPTEKTIKMRRIVAKGPPITKKEARQQAYEKLVKFGW